MSNTNNRPSLTREAVAEMAGALHRITEIESRVIKQKDDDVELKAAKDWLIQKLFANASELLGNWFVNTDEYQPLVNIYARLQLRAAGVNRQYLSQPAVVEGSEATDGK